MGKTIGSTGMGYCRSKVTSDDDLCHDLRAHERDASEPTCHMTRGLAEGCLEAYLNRKTVSFLTSSKSKSIRAALMEKRTEPMA